VDWREGEMREWRCWEQCVFFVQLSCLQPVATNLLDSYSCQVDWRDGEMREWLCWKGAVRVLCTAELLATSCNELGLAIAVGWTGEMVK
jgi:hypothetical protein